MKVYFLLIIALLLILNVILIAFKGTDQNKISNKKNTSEIDILNSSVLLQVKYNSGISIGDTLYDENNKYYGRKYLVEKSPVLIFRFTERNCDVCIDFELGRLRNLAKRIGYDKVVLLTSYSDRNDLKILKSKYLKGFTVYNIPYKQMENNEIESLNAPYYFLLNQKLVSSLLFIPEKLLPVTTDFYYKEVESQINNIISKQITQSRERTEIKFNKTSLKFRDLKRGVNAVAKFNFSNKGINPLIIKLVTADCGCVIANYPRNAIKPGESGIITLTYNNNAHGVFSKTVTVFANTDPEPIVLNISGNSL